MTSKINRKDVIGPLTDEQANHVWQILHDAGEPTFRGKPDYSFNSKDIVFTYRSAWGTHDLPPTISYDDFVEKMSAPNPKWLNTKWDVRDWTPEQKVAFQEECFRCGYEWINGARSVRSTGATAYSINKNGQLTHWFLSPMNGFEDASYGAEKKWEDMFPNGSIEIGNPSQEPQSHDHECWLYYSHTQDCCLKCHPEKDLRQRQVWGILDTARREREYIEEVRRGRK